MSTLDSYWGRTQVGILSGLVKERMFFGNVDCEKTSVAGETPDPFIQASLRRVGKTLLAESPIQIDNHWTLFSSLNQCIQT